MLAACQWCSAKFGENTGSLAPSVLLLSDDIGDGGGGAPESDALGARGGEEVKTEGGAPTSTRTVRELGLHGFLREFVGTGEAAEELARRGDLLRGVHLSNKVWRERTLLMISHLSAVSSARPEEGGIFSIIWCTGVNNRCAEKRVLIVVCSRHASSLPYVVV